MRNFKLSWETTCRLNNRMVWRDESIGTCWLSSMSSVSPPLRVTGMFLRAAATLICLWGVGTLFGAVGDVLMGPKTEKHTFTNLCWFEFLLTHSLGLDTVSYWVFVSPHWDLGGLHTAWVYAQLWAQYSHNLGRGCMAWFAASWKPFIGLDNLLLIKLEPPQS